MNIRKRTISTMSTKSAKGLGVAEGARPTTPPPLPSSSSTLPNASTTPKSITSSKASDRESLGASPSKNGGLKGLGRKVSHSRPVRMLRNIGSFGSRKSLGTGGQGRRMSSSSLQSMEHDQEHEHDHDHDHEEHGHGQSIEERLGVDALALAPRDAPVAVAIPAAAAEHEETASCGAGPESAPVASANEGENVAETRTAELGDIVEDEDVKGGSGGEEAEHEHEHEHEQPIESPSVVIVGPGPDFLHAGAEAEAEAGAVPDAEADVDTEDTHSIHRPQHSIDHSVSSTATAVDIDEIILPVSDHHSELDLKKQVLLPLIKVTEEQDVAVQPQTTPELDESIVIVNAPEIPLEAEAPAPATNVEEVEPYIIDELPLPQAEPMKAASAEAGPPTPAAAAPVESAPPVVLVPTPTEPEASKEAAQPTTSPTKSPTPAPTSTPTPTSIILDFPAAVPASASAPTPQTSSKVVSQSTQPTSTASSLDEHAPELHTPPPISSLTALFTPTPQMRSLVSECARLSWWVAITAAPSALIYIYHHRRTIFNGARS